MNTRYLEEYLAFSQELNFSIAAKKLFIARPTLNEHITELESELGCQLVERGKGKAELTSAGRRFAQTASDVLASWDLICNEYRNLADNLCPVTICSSNLPWLEGLIHQARRVIAKKHPEKSFEIITDNGPLATLDALGERANDIVVVGQKRFASKSNVAKAPNAFVVSTEQTYLLIGEENPLFEKERICAADLDGAYFLVPPDVHQGYVRDGFEEEFLRHGARITLKTSHFHDHFEYFAHDAGKHIGIVPETLAPRFGITGRRDCRMVSMDDFDLTTDFVAVFREGFLDTANGKLLFDAMRELADSKKQPA